MQPQVRLILSTEQELWGCHLPSCANNSPRFLQCSKLSSALQLWGLCLPIRGRMVQSILVDPSISIFHPVRRKFIKQSTNANQQRLFTLASSWIFYELCCK